MNKTKQTITIVFAIILAVSSIMMILEPAAAAPKAAAGIIDPKTIPKFTNQLITNIPVYTPTNVLNANNQVIRQDYTVTMTTLNEEILPVGTPIADGTLGPNGAPLTHVWGYSGLTNAGVFSHSPSATFIATTGIPTKVTWINAISEPQFLPVDPTIHWANPNMMPMNMPGTAPGLPPPYPSFPPGFDGTVTTLNPNGYNAQSPVPLVPHLHDAEVLSTSDGGPDAWFTYNGITGPTYSSNDVELGTAGASNQAVYNYPNAQNPTTLWYHDHALGMTRLNVMSGLAGFYLLKNPAATTPITTLAADGSNFDQYMTQTFTYGVNEIPLAIQDRTFKTDGSLWFPTVGINPAINPYWMPEFFGNTIMVNGKVWPNLNVTQGAYRLRVLDGSNARFYTLAFSNKMPFTVIGSDGGYLQQPAVVTSLTIAPGERYDIIADFSAVPVGTKIVMTNTARAPFPGGSPASPQDVGQVMQFTVAGTAAAPGTAANNVGATPPVLPAGLNPTIPVGAFPTIAQASVTNTRIRTLYEVMGPSGPMMVTLNGQQWDGVITEDPANGSTEDWVIINLTGDTHPIHLHLVTFQLVSRQPFQATKYTTDWLAINAGGFIAGNMMPPFRTDYVPQSLSPIPYLQGKATTALPQEMGWKDTIQMNPGEVTTIRVHFGSNTGAPFSFDPTQGPGYVWHCHIVDHEDNEMMRPYIVT